MKNRVTPQLEELTRQEAGRTIGGSDPVVTPLGGQVQRWPKRLPGGI